MLAIEFPSLFCLILIIFPIQIKEILEVILMIFILSIYDFLFIEKFL